METATVPAAPAPVAVAGDRPSERAEACSALRAAGFPVREAADGESLVKLLAPGAPEQHGAVIILAAFEAEADRWLEQLARTGLRGRLPVVLVTGGSVPAERIAQWDPSEFLLRPLQPAELVLRVRAALARNSQRAERREKTEAMRSRTRRISEAIRGSHDPQAMSRDVIAGLGEAFGVEHSWIVTFGDERVPEQALGWSADGIRGATPALAEDAVRPLAAQLWEDATVLAVPDHRDPALAPSCDPLAESAARDGLRSSLIVPLGHGASAFGLLWLGSDAPRTWTPMEASLVQHVAGNLAHGLVQGQLITAQRQVLERLRDLDRAKNEFVATVNHELRTPLSSIIGYLDLIIDDGEGRLPEETSRMLEVVARNAHRLHQLIEDVLMLSRSDAQQIRQSIEKFNLNTVLRSVVATMAPAAAAGDLRLQLEDPEPVQVEGDRAQLEQVFTNIISNAVKFTPSGGSVTVSLSSTDGDGGVDRACVRVADTGIGIPEDEVPKLYQRFFRGSNATAAAIQGTGLGLAIVQDLVHQHGGELLVQSRLGEGTTISVELPVHR
jgi:two-component system, OmpR family, phosphate regulon sensor histidine kinase PhoR